MYRLIPIVFIVSGCSQHSQPKGWLSVEKSPIRVIIVDNEKDIEPGLIHRVISSVKTTKYEDVDFNENTNIGINFDANAHHSSSNSNVWTVD